MQESDSFVLIVAAASGAIAGAAALVVGVVVAFVLFVGIIDSVDGDTLFSRSSLEAVQVGALEGPGESDEPGELAESNISESSELSGASQTEEQALSTAFDATFDSQALDEMNRVGSPAYAENGQSGAGAEALAGQAGHSEDAFISGINAHIEAYLQNPALPGGCEIVSMTAVLRALGNDIDALQFTDDYVMRVEGEPSMVNSYSGTPYKNGAAFPPVMAQAGNNYLREYASEYRFSVRDNLSFERLLGIVETGRPVLVWTTMFMATPSFTGDVIAGYRWYSNEHCVVLYGQDDAGNLLVMDPLEGAVVRDRSAFEDIYDACGRYAITLTRADTERIDRIELADAKTSDAKATD